VHDIAASKGRLDRGPDSLFRVAELVPLLSLLALSVLLWVAVRRGEARGTPISGPRLAVLIVCWFSTWVLTTMASSALFGPPSIYL
jgi:hypothetical protein